MTKNMFLILCLMVPHLSGEMQLYINEMKMKDTLCLESCLKKKGKSIVKRYDCAEEEIDVYECAAGTSTRKKITLKNPKIDLEFVVVEIDKYLPKDLRYHNILENKMNNNFLNDINNMKLITADIFIHFCYNVNVYDGKNLVISFGTNGHYFYDRKNKLMYVLKSYDPEKNLLYKYWGIWEENHCR